MYKPRLSRGFLLSELGFITCLPVGGDFLNYEENRNQYKL